MPSLKVLAAPEDFVDQDAPASVTPQDFRRALGQYATGVTVITAVDGDGRPYGVTCSSFGSLSLAPPLIQWSLKAAAWSHPIFAGAERFAVNILAASQQRVSKTFSSPGVDRFAVTPHVFGAHGAPLLEGAAAWLECALEQRLTGGDHSLFIGRVLQATTFDKAPLLHWAGRYGELAALE